MLNELDKIRGRERASETGGKQKAASSLLLTSLSLSPSLTYFNIVSFVFSSSKMSFSFSFSFLSSVFAGALIAHLFSEQPRLLGSGSKRNVQKVAWLAGWK